MRGRAIGCHDHFAIAQSLQKKHRGKNADRDRGIGGNQNPGPARHLFPLFMTQPDMNGSAHRRLLRKRSNWSRLAYPPEIVRADFRHRLNRPAPAARCLSRPPVKFDIELDRPEQPHLMQLPGFDHARRIAGSDFALGAFRAGDAVQQPARKNVQQPPDARRCPMFVHQPGGNGVFGESRGALVRRDIRRQRTPLAAQIGGASTAR